jgi:uncharacterized protein (DUF305 family)
MSVHTASPYHFDLHETIRSGLNRIVRANRNRFSFPIANVLEHKGLKVMRTTQFTVATLATILIASSVLAQENQNARTQAPPSRTTPGQSTGEPQTKEQTLAHCLVIANHEQVLLSRFAKDRATHADVKAFAEKLEKDHQNTLDQLKTFSPYAVAIAATNERTDRADAGRTAANRAQATELAETSLRKIEGQTSQVDFLQLHQEISTQCLQDGKEMLSAKEAIEFDQCFVGMQVAKHASAHSMLTVLERHTTGKFQALVKSQLGTNSQHMEAAVSLMKKLADSDSSKPIR